MGEKLLDTGRVVMYDRTDNDTYEHDYKLIIETMRMGTDYDDWSAVMDQFDAANIGDSQVKPTEVRIGFDGKSVSITRVTAKMIMNKIEYNEDLGGIR